MHKPGICMDRARSIHTLAAIASPGKFPGGICAVRVTEGLASNTAKECTMADAIENRTGRADVQGDADRGKEANGPTGWSSR